jgi:hypothetical protein
MNASSAVSELLGVVRLAEAVVASRIERRGSVRVLRFNSRSVLAH